MPTVHLSLSDAMYRQLKEKSDEIGIQVTDLIKLYIKTGLQGGLASRQPTDEALLANFSNRLDRLEKDLKLKVTMVEGKYRQLEEEIEYIIERLESLEEGLEDLRVKRTLAAVERAEASNATST